MSDQISNEEQVADLKRKVDLINQVSPSFCLAKWLQSTVYLHNGMTHSCHHPTPHKIPLAEIKKDPSALHNTQFKQDVRQQMMAGKQPKECQYCWNIENLGNNHISDRHYKSADSWAFPYLEKVKSQPRKNTDPTYLEVAFESTCNFKCAYCTPDISTKWMEEIRSHGPYPTSNKTGNLNWLESTGRMPIAKSEHNPYIEAFWAWWPTLRSQLHTFRITGGEPLLSQHTWRVLEDLEANSQEKMNLAINTNLGVSDKLIDKLISKYNSVSPQIKSFEIFTSCEASGKAAEYIRFGLNYESFIENIRKFLSATGDMSRINIMVTFNILSTPSFDLFLQEVLKLRREFNKTDAFNRIPLMINYLRWPEFMSMCLLPQDLKESFIGRYQKVMKEHNGNSSKSPGRFYIEELDQIDRLGKFMLTTPEQMQKHKRDFAVFFQEYDKRKKLDFANTFPELADFYQSCLKLI